MTKQEGKTIEDEREKNAARQRRYREKKKQEVEACGEKSGGNFGVELCLDEPHNVTKNVPEFDPWRSWKKGKRLIESPAYFGLLSLVIFITTMLVIMQAEVYMAMDHSHAIALAVLTEVLLVVLFALRFQGVLWLVNAGMITLLVLYNLGLLGYGGW